MINPCLTKVKQRYLRTVQEDDPNWGVDQETHCTYSKHHGELVGGLNPSEKYSVGITIPHIWKNKKCSKPPTSWGSNDVLLRATHLLRATAKQKGY
jgi:hypothetical protein